MKTTKFIAHSSGAWEVPGSGRLDVWLLVSQTALFFLYPHIAKIERELSEISFLRALIPFMKRIIDYAEVVIISVMPGKRQVLVLL